MYNKDQSLTLRPQQQLDLISPQETSCSSRDCTNTIASYYCYIEHKKTTKYNIAGSELLGPIVNVLYSGVIIKVLEVKIEESALPLSYDKLGQVYSLFIITISRMGDLSKSGKLHEI